MKRIVLIAITLSILTTGFMTYNVKADSNEWNVTDRWPVEARTASGAAYGIVKSDMMLIVSNPSWTSNIIISDDKPEQVH